jgi:glycosyltransferase involved in cell wall biosynthesis
MNILFVLYGDLACNSASHVDGVARELCARGETCVVAVPHNREGAHRFVPHPYRVVTFAEALARPLPFPGGRGPDLAHFWNPREVNRTFHAELASRCAFKTVIHLEDNEDHITRCMLGPQLYARAERGVFPGEFPATLSHPRRSRQFMAQADGFSLLIASLAEKVPAAAPRVVFWPATDAAIFHPRPRNDALRAELGISPETCVLTYHGNTHGANFHEVRSLYLAVALLNRRGVPARLIRLGTTYVEQPPEYHAWVAEFCVEMGFVVDRQRIADVLATADLYVQPGTSDPFNDYRFPSKVPEFFALGRPVVLPKTNVGLVTRHLTDAYVLEEANGAGICEAVARLWADPGLRERLSRGARAFSAAHFSWARSGEALARFYQRLLGTTASKPAPRRAA